VTVSALLQLQHAAANVLLQLSDTAPAKTSFQLYVSTKDVEAGSETWSASGSPILAAMARDMETQDRAGHRDDDGDRKVRKREEVFHVEVPAFAAVGGLTDDYRFTRNGVEHAISSAVLCDDETYYVVKRSTGGV
jgi:hypothetical protein